MISATTNSLGIRRLLGGLLTACILSGPPVQAAELRVAVASNFAPTMKELARLFSAQSGHHVIVSAASTGKLYAQIINGAPFDLFFAADTDRPDRLTAAGLTVADSDFVYAVGRLVLWSPSADRVDAEGAVLARQEFRFLAIANPRLAPYGNAAQATLEKLQLWEALQPRLVRGENIGQTFNFVRTGNAELGFVAASQLVGLDGEGSRWDVPASMHGPILQKAVTLKESGAASELALFVRSESARELIRAHGYAVPAQ